MAIKSGTKIWMGPENGTKFWQESLKRRDIWIHGRIILKLILNK
jgi:hypothetical protein